MGLRFSYTLLSPLYEAIVQKASASQRKINIDKLQSQDIQGRKIVIPGIGTGLDIPYLSEHSSFYGFDITPRMLNKAKKRAHGKSNIHLQIGDVMDMPYQDNSFDHAILHLILAVVPDPLKVLQETQRIIKPGGKIYIFDKFLKPNQRAWLRKLMNPVISRIATRTNVVFEPLLEATPALTVVSDEAALINSWFRRIVLQKQ